MNFHAYRYFNALYARRGSTILAKFSTSSHCTPRRDQKLTRHSAFRQSRKWRRREFVTGAAALAVYAQM